MTKQKQSSKTTALPKTLWGFYFRYAFRGHYWLIIASFALMLLVSFDRIVQPLAQQWTYKFQQENKMAELPTDDANKVGEWLADNFKLQR